MITWSYIIPKNRAAKAATETVQEIIDASSDLIIALSAIIFMLTFDHLKWQADRIALAAP